MAIRRFEEIRAWQEARALTKRIYTLGKTSPGLRRDRRLRDQLQSASVSIMSNIAEGFSRRTAKEFTQFLFVAKGSAAEAEEVARILSGFITSLLRQSAPRRRGNGR